MKPKRQEDHEQLLEEVMNEYGNDVLWLAYSYVKDKSLAEDISQQVFLKFYQSIEKFKGQCSMKTWIFTLTVNQCKDYFRTSYFKRVILSSEFLKREKDSPLDSKVIKKDENQRLKDTVMKLPIKYRMVIMLYYFEELTIKEVSFALGMNEATVKTNLRRGKITII